MRILIIDDDVYIRETLRIILERWGYEIEEASNGKTGLKIHHNNPVDLVIMDIIMPEKEGLETIMELRRDSPEVKIIAISGGGIIDAQECLYFAEKLGAQEIIAKPFGMNELKNTFCKLGL